MKIRPSQLTRFGVISVLLTASAACESAEEQKPLTTDEPAAETTKPVVSPEIAEAVAKAEASAGTAVDPNAPPESGILSPERAQADAPAGAPPKIVLGKAGDEPRFVLSAPEPDDERIGQMTLMVRTGPNTGMPGVAFKFEVAKEKPAKGKGEAEPSAAATPGFASMGVEVVDASLASEQMGEVPPELATLIATLKGSTMHYRSQDGAVVGDTAVELGKKTDERVGALLAAMADTFRLVLISTPKEPIGKGGFWMVTQREKLSLGEVVGYHLVTVANVENGRVTLNVETKRYLAAPEFQGLPALQFMGTATTDIVMIPGQRLPLEGRTQQSLQALVQREGSQPRPLMFDIRALFAFPPKDGAAPAGSAPGGSAPHAAAPKTDAPKSPAPPSTAP